MIEPQGYIPAKSFYLSLTILIEQWASESPTAPDDDDFSHRRELYEKSEWAAEQLVQLLHNRSAYDPERLLHLYSPNYGPIPLSSFVTQRHNVPNFFMIRKPDGPSRRLSSLEAVRNTRHIWLEELHLFKPDLSSAPRPSHRFVFDPNRDSPIHIPSGRIKLTPIRQSIKTISAGSEFLSALEEQNASLTKAATSQILKGRDMLGELETLLQHLSPFEPFPILVREQRAREVMKALKSPDAKTIQLDKSSISISGQIIHLSENSRATKKEIFEAINGERPESMPLSWRQFQLHWSKACEEKPELSKPGRKN